MNGYDFDKTIYDGDSFLHFYLFTLKRRPFLLLLAPLQVFAFLLYLIKLLNKKQIKEVFMLNLLFFKNRQAAVDAFWKKNLVKIKPWYLAQKQADDVIISASPLFLVKGACDKLGLSAVFATDMNLDTLKIEGKNCYGQNKVEKFEQHFGKDFVLDTFYSDSLSDMPMMKKSKKGIFVKGNERTVIFEK